MAKQPTTVRSSVAALVLCGLFVATDAAATLVASVLPTSRSVQTGQPATVFATIINSSADTRTDCQIRLGDGAPQDLDFRYFLTDRSDNSIIGEAGPVIDLPPAASQSYLLEFTSETALDPTEIHPVFICSDQQPVRPISGINSLIFSVATEAPLDMIAFASTSFPDGILRGAFDQPFAFALSSINVGTDGQVRTSARGSGAASAMPFFICRTNTQTGACLAPPQSEVTADMQTNEASTWSVFVQTDQPIPFNPAESRIVIEFFDSNDIQRGATSIALIVDEIIDMDSDGIADAADNCPATHNQDQLNTDRDQQGDACDLDDDNDGTNDSKDAFRLDPIETNDSDSDGIGDNTDNCPDHANQEQTNSDDDELGDACDAFPDDDSETADRDGDGTGDNADAFPDDDSETADRDGDGTGDNADAFPDDDSETTDSDRDSVGDNIDNCPNNFNSNQRDIDRDGTGDACDPRDDRLPLTITPTPSPIPPNRDSDGDGRDDRIDNCPLIANTNQNDTDIDGIGNVCDDDDDNDGFNDDNDAFPLYVKEWLDTDSDGIGDNADDDDDDDRINDNDDNCPLIHNPWQVNTDTDNNGDACDDDDDDDGEPDDTDNCKLVGNPSQIDTNRNGIGDACDDDDDEDGEPNDTDNCRLISNKNQLDNDEDGAGDACDDDDDNDQIKDKMDNCPFVPNPQQTDTLKDNIGDSCRVYIASAAATVELLPGEGGTVITNDLTAISAYNRPLTFTLVREPAFGNVTFARKIDGGYSYTYTTSHSEVATDRFVIIADDGEFQSESATVLLSLNTDPLYKYQWHLENTGQSNFADESGVPGEDLRLIEPIRSGLTGKGITIAVINNELAGDNIDADHEDLHSNTVNSTVPHFTSPVYSFHRRGMTTYSYLLHRATGIAGIIAAKGWNNTGVRGVAPNASLKSFNLLHFDRITAPINSSAIISAFGGEQASWDIDIFNFVTSSHAYFTRDVAHTPYSYNIATSRLSMLRDGKGALLVAGSGDTVWVDCEESLCSDSIIFPFSVYPQTITVAALLADGKQASYSLSGATTWISGFGGGGGHERERFNFDTYYRMDEDIYKPGIMTSDPPGCQRETDARNNFNSFDDYVHNGPKEENSGCNYTSTFYGTSAAAASVSGALALVLEANEDLTWRNVKYILAKTARQVDVNSVHSVDGINYLQWIENAAGFKHHNSYGFGAMDTTAAIRMARQWKEQGVPLMQRGRLTERTYPIQRIDAELPTQQDWTTSINVSESGIIEFVKVKIYFDVDVTRVPSVRLESPSGTVATLLQPRNLSSEDHFFNRGNNTIELAAAAFFNEEVVGTWTLRLRDHEILIGDNPTTVSPINMYGWIIQFYYMDTNDDDADGVSNALDNCPEDINQNQIDIDNDGFGNPCDDDDDDDGRIDDADNCRIIANHDQLDTDGDQAGDACDEDDDDDGYDDNTDNCPLVANQNQSDIDDDGVGDMCDAFPNNKAETADRDGDGIGDIADAFPEDNSEFKDSDDDGVGDNEDNCPLDINLYQLDFDRDGIGNACDEDDDGDGHNDSADNCPLIVNRMQTDKDGDNVGDVCDAYPNNRLETTDHDGDGVGDNADNCPFVVNQDQNNVDRDHLGDACDQDDDGDGLFDSVDNCPLVSNRDQRDRDGDNAGDACDVFPDNKAEASDQDGDGIGDNADVCVHINNPNQADSDYDGVGNICDEDDDNDGVIDTEDAFPLDVDEVADSDGDGLGDNEDRCPADYNLFQRDFDRDRISDICDDDDDWDGVIDIEDAFPYDPAESSDRDKDRVGDNEDNCPDIANSDQLDTDNDDIGDSCDDDDDNDGTNDNDDAFPLDDSETVDSDADMIGDNTDNCPDVGNHDQMDTDDDGFGDVCDDDDDNDQVKDNIDNCQFIYNPQQIDSEGDETGDACRIHVASASATVDLMPGEEKTIATGDLAVISAYDRPLNFTLVREPAHGSVTFAEESGGGYTYTYATSHVETATDRFEVIADDGDTQSAPATITLSLNTDPLYKRQWHLENTGQNGSAGAVGEDLRIIEPIRTGFTGKGVIVAVIDTDLDIDHEDLRDNVIKGGSHNFDPNAEDPTDPSHPTRDHGTLVAGVIAARGWNNIGIRGVAPNASLKGFNWNLIAHSSDSNFISALGGERYSSDVDIFNASIGSPGTIFSTLEEYAITGVLPTLRGGKGALFVKAAGNYFDIGALGASCLEFKPHPMFGCADSIRDARHLFPQTIVVGALAADGTKASYSSVGATTWISGYGGDEHRIWTTTRRRGTDQYSSFTGTSLAAPTVSGALALVLEANEDLTWRNVKYILAKTARQVDTNFVPVTLDGITYYQWVENAAGFKHHNWYGFGAMDTAAAVRMAVQWKDEGVPLVQRGRLTEWHAYQRTPNLEPFNMKELSFPTTIDKSGSIEFIRVRLRMASYSGTENHLGVRLKSPSGTVATLLQPRIFYYTNQKVHQLAAAAFFNEEMEGTWTLMLFSHGTDEQALFGIQSWSIQFYYVDTADDDADKVQNAFDNCQDTSNPNQSDIDEDGVGDVCDDFPADADKS